MVKCNSCQIGKIARSLLTPGACGRVLAGFSRAAFLVTEQEELFWLASENTPMHQRGMQISGPIPKLAAGEKFFSKGEYIKIAHHLEVDFGDACAWTAFTIPSDAALEIEKIPIRAKSLFLNSLDLSQASGFGRLIPKILSLVVNQPEEEVEIDPVLSCAWLGIYEIAKACLMHDMPGLWQEAHALVGLGEGLTPSGDDFLGGLLFCVNTLQRFYPGYICLDSSDQASFIDAARKRTHLISFTLLKDLIYGQAVEPLHELIDSIMSDRPLESIRLAACLTKIGHSTGWDLLTGVLTGLLLTFHCSDSINSSTGSLKQGIFKLREEILWKSNKRSKKQTKKLSAA